MSEIITPNTKSQEPLLPAPGAPFRFPAKPISADMVNEAYRLFGIWVRANAISVVTAESEAEKHNTALALSQFFLQHGGELIGAWITIHNEYEPILRAFTPIVGRSVDHINAVAAAQAAATPKK